MREIDIGDNDPVIQDPQGIGLRSPARRYLFLFPPNVTLLFTRGLAL